MTDESKLPAWAQERLDEEASMGGSFEGSTGSRVGYTIGLALGLAWHALVWVLSIAFVTVVIVFTARAMGLL